MFLLYSISACNIILQSPLRMIFLANWYITKSLCFNGQRKCFFKKNQYGIKIEYRVHNMCFWIYHHQLRPRPKFWKAKNIECLELTNQTSLNIKAKNRLRSTLREGVATLVLVNIQLFSNVNLETNISFKSCQYKITSYGRMVPFGTDRTTAAITL